LIERSGKIEIFAAKIQGYVSQLWLKTFESRSRKSVWNL